MEYFDIHCHLNSDKFDNDRAQIIERAVQTHVKMITVGTDLEESQKGVDLATKNDNIWTVVGMHPIFAMQTIFDHAAFESLAKQPKVVAIGECGLDFFHSKPEDIAKQIEIFEKQIALANMVGKPLMLHVRNSKEGNKDAYLQAIDILKKKARVRANFHFFAGNMEDLRAILDINCTVSFTGVITFARNYDEVIRYAPLTHIMSETDCPDVSPVPYRGKRNEPSYVVEVVKALANIRNERIETVAQQLSNNAKQIFNLSS